MKKSLLVVGMLIAGLFGAPAVGECNLEDFRPSGIGWTATTLSFQFTNNSPTPQTPLLEISVLYDNSPLTFSFYLPLDPYGTTDVFIDFHGPFSLISSELLCDNSTGITDAPDPIEITVTKQP